MASSNLLKWLGQQITALGSIKMFGSLVKLYFMPAQPCQL